MVGATEPMATKARNEGSRHKGREEVAESELGVRAVRHLLYSCSLLFPVLMFYHVGGARGGRGSRFAQGLGNQMPGHISQRT